MFRLFKLLQDLLVALKMLTAEMKINSDLIERSLYPALVENNTHLLDLNNKLDHLIDVITFPPDPGPVSLLIFAQEDVMLVFDVSLPALPTDASDIQSGELTIKIGDADEQVIATDKAQGIVAGLKGDAGAQVTGSFTYIDGSGNRSVHPSTLDAVLSDTIPPPDPGVLGIAITGQE